MWAAISGAIGGIVLLGMSLLAGLSTGAAARYVKESKDDSDYDKLHVAMSQHFDAYEDGWVALRTTFTTLHRDEVCGHHEFTTIFEPDVL